MKSVLFSNPSLPTTRAEVVIRPYVPSDYPQVFDLWQAASMDPFTPQELARVVAMEGGILVAEHCGKREGSTVVGVVIWTHYGKYALVWRLAVSEAHRGQGIATSLLQQTEQVIRLAGFKKVGLLVHEANAPARKLYASQGWTHLENVETWWKTLAE